MATRGAKPKPAHLRVVDGTHRTARHGEVAAAEALKADAEATFGKLEKPPYLKRDAAKAWAQFIAPAGWLDGSKAAAAIAFCELWGEFREGPKAFPASKHSQMRAYMSELGLTDERNRKSDGGKAKDPAEDYFA